MNVKIFRGEVEVSVRYEIKDGHLWLASYDAERAIYGYGNGRIYCYSYSGAARVTITGDVRRLKAISENDLRRFCLDNLPKAEGFLSWLEKLVDEHKDEIAASAPKKEAPAMEIVQKVDNVIPMVRTAENSNLSGIAEDIVIDCYLGTNIPEETREMVKSFLMTVKRRTSSYSALG